MEVMTLAQERGSLGDNGTPRVENSVDYVDGPGASEQKDCDPGLETDVRCQSQSVCPHDRNTGRVEAGKVPRTQNTCANTAQLRPLQRVGLTI